MDSLLLFLLSLLLVLKMENNQEGRIRWNCFDALCLLRAVVADNPFEDADKWNIVRQSVEISCGNPFT